MRYLAFMRTTLSIDSDVLEAARVIATRERVPLGTIGSQLARQALNAKTPHGKNEAATSRMGIPQLVVRDPSRPVTLELVNQFRDEDK